MALCCWDVRITNLRFLCYFLDQLWAWIMKTVCFILDTNKYYVLEILKLSWRFLGPWLKNSKDFSCQCLDFLFCCMKDFDAVVNFWNEKMIFSRIVGFPCPVLVGHFCDKFFMKKVILRIFNCGRFLLTGVK